MRAIKKPEYNQGEIFLLCTSNLRDKNYKTRLEACVEDIVNGVNEYEAKMEENLIHTISKQSSVSVEDMKKLYERKFVPQSGPARKFYDALMGSAPGELCPYCGQRNVTTLDHYLPKSLYPLYAVTMINLIPVCYECNITKEDLDINEMEDAFIHPYFDVTIDDHIWLSCKIEEKNNELIFIFDVVQPIEWSALLFQRMKNHFTKLKLSRLYSIHATGEFGSVRGLLAKRLEESPSALKSYIEEMIESRSANDNNSWQVSMYRAMRDYFDIICDFLR